MSQSYYQLDYFDPEKNTPNPRKNRVRITAFVWSICFFCFAVILFGGIGAAIQHRGEHLSLRERHNTLQLRYDSLFAAKLQLEKQLVERGTNSEFYSQIVKTSEK